jgi:hypothetical protein
MEEKGIKDDRETFALFELFDKLKKRPEELTEIERLALRGFRIEI